MENKKIKILLVDDDEAIRTTYAEVFRREGYVVTEAMDGLGGLDKATQDVPDVIFTGIIMPRMDGFALKEALAKNVATANVPVLMSSHMGREEDRKRAIEMGVKDFIISGMVSPREVVERVRVMLGNSAKGYRIKFSLTELDAPELDEDLQLSNFQCPECKTEMNLFLTVSDIEKHEFKAKFVCPKCQ
ncbi:MAG: response regulator [Candidatus Pacebacteria bacterium]|nr:response regulator [Candidatus Paceibacterota bacterium]MDR3583550.1 response regulator [Candidatus Paceibacterota bacterium]